MPTTKVLRVLVADDDPGVREFVESVLADAQFSATFAGDGGQALEFLQAAEFGWRPEMRRVQQRLGLAWKDGRFQPSVCISIDTPPEQAHREANLIYPLPE